MLIMAIDPGERRTGIAFSDATGSIVGRTMVLECRSASDAAKGILRLAEENKPQRIVIGYPKNMNGTLGPGAEKSEALAGEIRKSFGGDVILWDERLTTVDAHRILAESGKNAKKRKGTVDAVAAALILEGYIGSL